MRTGTMLDVLNELDIDRLASLVHPSLLRRERVGAVHDGLRQVIRHTVRVNESAGTNRVIAGRVELNVLSLRDHAGTQLVLLTEHSPHACDSVRPRVTSVPVAAEAELALSPWGEPPTFDAALPLHVPNPRHLLAHPERWEGFTAAQVHARIRPALRELGDALASSQETVAHYFYLARDPLRSRWSAVAPLRLDRSDPPLAVVLNAEQDRITVVTILDRHTAFWNVSATGTQPPSWLDGTLPALGRDTVALAA